MAPPDLVQLVEDPDTIVAIPAAEIPRLIGDAEALKARLWARLQECSAPAATPPLQRGNGAHRLITAGQAVDSGFELASDHGLMRSGWLDGRVSGHPLSQRLSLDVTFDAFGQVPGRKSPADAGQVRACRRFPEIRLLSGQSRVTSKRFLNAARPSRRKGAAGGAAEPRW